MVKRLKIIEVNDIKKKFGRKHVLKGVSFTAEKGEITCIIGINGVGKTTILNAIMNLTPLNRGQILINGETIHKHSYEKITLIPHACIRQTSMTSREALQRRADVYASRRQERAAELLDFFKLQESEKINHLSKGNRAKVTLLLGLAFNVAYF